MAAADRHRPRNGHAPLAAEREASGSLTQLLVDVAMAANASSRPSEATQNALERVCEATGASVGHAYVKDPGSPRLMPAEWWHVVDRDRFALLCDVTMSTSFEPGEGLPGRVLATGEPAWVADLHEGSRPRSEAAEQLGVRSAFASPVLIGEEVVAVLEFFHEEPTARDDQLLRALTTVGVQVGHAFERHRSQRQLRAREERFRVLAQASEDGVFVVEDGRIVDVNEAAERLFDRDRSELIGQRPSALAVEAHRGTVERNVDTCSPTPYVCLVSLPDGDHRWVRVRAGHVDTATNGTARIATVRDVTGRVDVPATPEAAADVDPGQVTLTPGPA